jgi:hypothetical protein
MTDLFLDSSNKLLYILQHTNITLVLSAWTDPPALAHYASTGWDTYKASLAPLTLLALRVLLDTIWRSLGH